MNQTDSPFKKQCQMICPPKLKMELPKVEYFFDDDLPIPIEANIILLPEGGWRELYIGNPFATQRKLGHICTPQFSIYKVRGVVHNVITLPNKRIIIDLSLEDDE